MPMPSHNSFALVCKLRAGRRRLTTSTCSRGSHKGLEEVASKLAAAFTPLRARCDTEHGSFFPAGTGVLRARLRCVLQHWHGDRESKPGSRETHSRQPTITTFRTSRPTHAFSSIDAGSRSTRSAVSVTEHCGDPQQV